jgi:hypothetical protein
LITNINAEIKGPQDSVLLIFEQRAAGIIPRRITNGDEALGIEEQ